MNNRWGKQVDSKSNLNSVGQNNINININFNGVKDQHNVFGGKKIDNYIQISNDPKPNIQRPNVSIQTLKYKKRSLTFKEQYAIENIKKMKKPINTNNNYQNKQKIIQNILTPQKNIKDKQTINNPKSLEKKYIQCTKKNIKQTENIQKCNQKSVNNYHDKQQYLRKINYLNSKENSKSKERSLSESHKKYKKQKQKKKITISEQTQKQKKIDNAISNKNDKEQQKNCIKKSKKNCLKNSYKKLEKNNKIQQPQIFLQTRISRKPSTQRITRNKSYQNNEPKKNNDKKLNSNNRKKKTSKDKQSKSLKRLPLFYQQQQPYTQDPIYQKAQKQINDLLNNEPFKHPKPPKKKQSPYEKYLSNIATNDDLIKLTNAATTIQKIWRGYKFRRIFFNQLNLIYHKNSITRSRIENKDPQFWDDSESNSILKANDDQVGEIQSSLNVSELHSQIQKIVSEKQNKVIKNHVIEQQMLERINKLQEYLKKYQQKAQKLQKQNKQLKNNLQKINPDNQNQFISHQQGINQTNKLIKKQKNQQIIDTLEENILIFNDNIDNKQKITNNEEFQLRLPKKILTKKQPKPLTFQPHQLPKTQQPPHQPTTIQLQSPSQSNIAIYKKKIQFYQHASPKSSPPLSLFHPQKSNTNNTNNYIIQLFKKKQNQLKQTYQKKISTYNRLLNDKIFSPRTHKIKKNQLDQIFNKQQLIIKNKISMVNQAVMFIKQIQQQQGNQQTKIIQQTREKPQVKQLTKSIQPPKQQKHDIQHSDQLIIDCQLQPSLQQQQHHLEFYLNQPPKSIFKKIDQDKQYLQPKPENKTIEELNHDAIKIFNQISEYHVEQDNHGIYITNQPPKLLYTDQALQSSQPNNIQKMELSKSEQPKKKQKILQTTLLFIKQYCVSFVQFIRNSPQHKNTFIQNICSPIIFNNFQFLKSYRTTLAHENQSSYNSQQQQYIYPFFKLLYPKTQIITRQAFNQFNSLYDKLQGQCDYQAQRQYFLNSLLDTFNESLDYKRPCSIYGETPLWMTQWKILKNYYLFNQNYMDKQNLVKSEKFDQICGIAISKVIDWSTCLCGFIPESPDMENIVIEEQQINHIRQSRIALMLEKDLLQSQENMLDFALEQTQVKLQVGLKIVEELIGEFTNEYHLVFFK